MDLRPQRDDHEDLAFLRDNTSPERLAGVRGDTDSELFFAYLLTRLDEACLVDEPAGMSTDALLRDVTRALRARPDFGAFNFLLSDGATTFAHRFGRSLYLLERTPLDAVRSVRGSREGLVVETPWSQRRHAILVASERLTDEPWEELADGTLVRLDRIPMPRWRLVDASRAA